MNEDSLIRKLSRSWGKHPSLIVGVGDDCAVLHPAKKGEVTLFKTDALVENVHFTRKMNPQLVGRKALARVISDMAAMGAEPTSALIAVSIPKNLPTKYVVRCYQGLTALARKYSIALAGGETTRSREFWFCISAIGSARKIVLRSTAKAGDLIFVTGKLGGSFPKRHLTFTPRLPEGQWLAQKGIPSSMMDLSDGLGKDLPRLALASRVSFHLITEQIPCHPHCTTHAAVNDGEDYELLFTVPPRKVQKLLSDWPFKTPLSCIGSLTPRSQKNIHSGITLQGFDHLA